MADRNDKQAMSLEEQQRRKDAFERLRQLKAEVSAHNMDLTEEQAMELADRFVREVIEEMAAKGKSDSSEISKWKILLLSKSNLIQVNVATS